MMDTIISGDDEAVFPPPAAGEEVVVNAAGPVEEEEEAERPIIEKSPDTTVLDEPGKKKLELSLVEEGANFHNSANESDPHSGAFAPSKDHEDQDGENEEEFDRKPAFSTIRRSADFPHLEESKMEEEGLPTGFSLVDKEVVLVDPTIITAATNTSSSGEPGSLKLESVVKKNNQESVPPRTTPPRGQEEQQRYVNNMEEHQFSAGPHPPSIPRRAAFGSASVGEGNAAAADDKKTYEYNFLRARHASAGPGLPLPDYKAQVNSRSFLRVNQDDLLVDGIPEDRQEGSSSSSATRQSAAAAAAAAAAITTSSSEDTRVSVPVVAQHVITSSMARRITDTTTANGGSHPQDDADIPVVSAVLVPQERLEAEHRQRSEGQNSGTTLSNTDSSVESRSGGGENHGRPSDHPSRSRHSRSKSRREPEEPRPQERKFWISVIVLALALNSVLVTGLVVASFCAVGKCGAGSSNIVADNVPLPSPTVDIPPTMAPTMGASRLLSSATPTLANMFSTGSTGDVFPPDGFVPEGANMTEIAPVAAGTATPAPTAPFFPKAPQPVSSDNGRTDGTFEDDEKPADETKESSSTDGLSIVGIEILFALATEVVIVGGLYLYYRWWQNRSKKLHEDAGSEPGSTAEEITSTCSNRNNRENRPDDLLASSSMFSFHERVDL